MKLKQSLLDIFLIILGSVFIALSFNVFVIPNNLVSGGIGGLAIITNHFTKWSVGLLIFLYNIPIMIWARKSLNLRFIIYTIIAIVLQSIFLNYITPNPYTNDVLLASIFGGILVGVGGGIIIRQYGSSGGVDVIAIVLRKKLGISIGTVSSITNLMVISLAALIFGLEPAMYTIVSLLVSGSAIDLVQEGLNKKNTAMIVSNQSHEIKEAIMFQLNRGVTLMHGSGGFENTEKNIIFCVVNQFELARLKELVTAIDSNAFMTFSETTEVLGRFSEHSFLWKKEKKTVPDKV
ncbi:MAG: YitT family protein [Dehalobacterium sp.]